MFLSRLFCVGASLFASTGVMGASCGNPVFTDLDTWGVDPRLELTGLSSLLPKEPVPYPESGKICKYYEGKDVCCGEDMLEIMYHSFAIANSTLEVARNAITNDAFIKSLLSAMKLLPMSNINKYVDGLEEKVKSLADSQLTCMEVLMAYTEGMTCFVCEPNFDKFIDNKDKVIEISKSTCNGVKDGCKPVYDNVNDIMKYMLKITNDFIPGMEKAMEGLPDMCGGTIESPGDCDEYVCDTWIDGVGIPNYVWEPAKFESINQIIESMQLLSENVIVAPRAAPKVDKSLETNLLGASPAKNKYTAKGYDALKVGCTDSSCPGASLTWLWVMLSILAVCTAAALSFVCVRRVMAKRRGNNGERMPLAPGNKA